MLQCNPDVAMDSVVHIIQNMTPQQRTDVLNTIRALETQIPEPNITLDSITETNEHVS